VVHTAEELAAVAELGRRHGVRRRGGRDPRSARAPRRQLRAVPQRAGAENGFSVLSATKGWNLAGLKGGAGGRRSSTPPATSPGCRRSSATAQPPRGRGALGRPRSGGDWLDALLAGLDDNRRLLDQLLAQHLPAVSWFPPAATYLAWLDCRRLGFDDDGQPPSRYAAW
jgi:cystathionine beta-lyase